MIQCKICNREFKNLYNISMHIKRNKKDHMSSEWYYENFLGGIKFCYCGKKSKFNNLVQGYHKYCSLKCGNSSIQTKRKRKKTILEKYGVEYPAQSSIIMKKIKNTNKEKYGGIGFASKELAKKTKNTMMKIYGVENPLQSKEIKQKTKQTCLEKYGTEYAIQNKEVKDKIKKTNLKRYGVEYSGQSFVKKEKSKQTWLKNYGVDNPMKSQNIQNKSKETITKKYSVHYMNLDKIKNKIQKTCLEKYSVDNPMKSEVVKEKSIQSLHKKFFNRLLNSDRLKDLVTPLFDLNDYKGIKYKYTWKCNKCETEFEDNIDNGKIPRCFKCYPMLNGTSKAEQEVLEFCKKLYSNIESNNRTILNGKEIDIYIPEIKLGIEYNGLYWHSELMGVNKNYHQNKTLLAKSKGIHLIQIFEDEWLNKQDIVKSILLNKMGKSPNKIFARKCIIKEIENKIAKQFLFDNHLQGEINGNHIGLYFKSELVSLITMGKSRFNKNYDYEILRFCNKLNTSITGGLSKLLSNFKKLNPNSSIITYADARFGTGSGYLNCGFEYKKLNNPNYFYMNHYNVRESRIGYQKHKLKDKLQTFDSTLTEWQNMQLNGFDRIWDCGNYTYEYQG